MEVRLSEWMCRYKDRCGSFPVTLNQLLNFVKSHDVSLTDVETTEDKFFEDKLCLLLRDWRFRNTTDDRDELIHMLIEKVTRLISDCNFQEESLSDLLHAREQWQERANLLKEGAAEVQQELVQEIAKLKLEKDESHQSLCEANMINFLLMGEIAELTRERDEKQGHQSDLDKLAQALPPAVRQAAAWIRDELPLLVETHELLEPTLASIPIFALRQTHMFMNASLAFGDNHDNSQESIFKLFDNLFRGRVAPGDMEPLEVKLPQYAQEKGFWGQGSGLCQSSGLCVPCSGDEASGFGVRLHFAQEELGIRSRNNRRLLALRAFQSTRLDECIMVHLGFHVSTQVCSVAVVVVVVIASTVAVVVVIVAV